MNGLNYGFAHRGEPFVSYNCWEKDDGRGTWTEEGSMHTRAVLHGDGTLRLPAPATGDSQAVRPR
jgi:hypothetical protein